MTPPNSPTTTQLKSCLKPMRSCLKQVDEAGGYPSPNTRQRRHKRRICFGRLEVHEHRSMMGDNPSCSDGAPITIDWKRVNHTVFDVEYYETYNPSEQRRSKKNLILTVGDRSEILLKAGYSMMDIVGCTLEVLKARQNRRDSYNNRKWDGLHQAIEKTTKTIKKAARRSSLLTSTTADVLLSPIKSPRRLLPRLKSDDRVTLGNLQSSLNGTGAVAA